MFVAAAAITVWWCGSMRAGMPMPGDWVMSMAWMRMPGQSWPAAATMFVAMWTVRMIAMMVPAVSAVLVHHRRPVRVAAAYFTVWIAVGIAIYPLGIALAALEMRSVAIARVVPIASGLVLVVAGIAQLSRWKRRALEHCRARACCALGRRPGPRQAWLDGLRLGRHCVRCCAPALLVLLALGVMDVTAMAVVTGAITCERLGPWPRTVSRGLGVAALLAGAVAIAVAP